MFNPHYFYLPYFQKALNYSPTNKREKFDERMDLLSKLLALYPFTDIKELCREFYLNAKYIRVLANRYGVHKSEDSRRAICKKNGDNPNSRKAYWYRTKSKKNN